MSVSLPDNYKRVLSSLAELIERKGSDLLDILQRQKTGHIVSVQKTFSAEERKEKIRLLEKLLEANRRFFSGLDLKPSAYPEDQVFRSDIAWLWTIINDSRTKRLKGYGKLDRETSAAIDEKISELLDIIAEIEQDYN
ncbi:MAG: hypothetical protein GXO83_02325 [Chlorobi bacterium]|nr:hypothetical protein [Chlorobiota bacterium]